MNTDPESTVRAATRGGGAGSARREPAAQGRASRRRTVRWEDEEHVAELAARTQPDQRQRGRRGRDQPPLHLAGRPAGRACLNGCKRPRRDTSRRTFRKPCARRCPAHAPSPGERGRAGDDLLPGRLLGRLPENLGQHPRVPLDAASDHDGSGACALQYRASLLARRDVPGGHHRHVHERDELRRQRVVRGARVHLLSRAGMQGQRRRPGGDEPRADLEAGARAVPQPASHLHAHRHVHGRGDRLHDPAGTIGVVEQRRAGAPPRDLPGGARRGEVPVLQGLDELHPLREHLAGAAPGLAAVVNAVVQGKEQARSDAVVSLVNQHRAPPKHVAQLLDRHPQQRVEQLSSTADPARDRPPAATPRRPPPAFPRRRNPCGHRTS